jgi:uncharacterized Fe-S center protein
MATEVFFHSLEQGTGPELQPVNLDSGLARLVAALGLTGAAGSVSPWGLKVKLGTQGHPPAIDPAWARAVADALAGERAVDPGKGSFCFDTLSISKIGLDQAETHLGMAKVKGYGMGGHGLPYLVADGPGHGDPLVDPSLDEHGLAALTLAPALARMAGVCLLNPVRSHPHVGFAGTLLSLGVGLADRPGKLLLHEDIRPKVNTPLCAGCGSCLAVCIFDAIAINAGRAFIDHEKCSGCGECMNVCFMAGISAEEASGIPRFQEKVAAAALAARNAVTGARDSRAGFFNFLVRLDRHSGGAKSRGRKRLGDVGVLAATDPVALDQATWDLVVARMDGPLSDWCGFKQEPGPLLGRAEDLGLGSRTYRLVEV